jgi:putative phosphotransacetylase
MTNKKRILVEVSHRHIHLAKEDIDSLFGIGYQLESLKQLSQSEEFATKETVTLINEDKKLEKVRVIGPKRKQTQVELSRTDANNLKLDVPLKESGDLDHTPGIEVEGPQGKIKLEKGLIIAKRHLHCSTQEAKELNLTDGNVISIKIPGERGLIFNEVVVRIHDNYTLSVHLDRDEANAAGIDKEVYGELVN